MSKRQVELVLAAQNKTDKSFNDVNKNITKLEKHSKRIRTMGSIFTGLIAGAGAGVIAMNALSDSLVESLDVLDNLGKTSRRLGLTTDELQELRAVAKSTGVEISAFDTAFQRFARRAGQARLGTGELIKTFDILGIELNDNEGNLKSNASLFEEFGNKIAAVSDENIQLALTMSGVDTEGVKLIEMFRTSSEVKQEVINKARELGAVYDESLIKKAEAYRTEIGLIEDAQDALNNQAKIGMSSMIIEWEKLVHLVIEAKNETLRYIGWQGVANDSATKTLIEANKAYKTDIGHLKKKLELEKDPTRQKFIKTNLEYAEKAQKATEKEIKDKISYYEVTIQRKFLI